VRLEESQKTAGKLAVWLKGHPHVREVYYPGLDGHAGKSVNDTQSDGPGAVLSFTTDTVERARHFLDSVTLAAPAVSLGGVETIASYPVQMSHAAIPLAERARLGITDTLIRISAGLEDPADLIEDLDRALKG
jgi:cystathionine beta-lyase/cystathionine gamma-synthase